MSHAGSQKTRPLLSDMQPSMRPPTGETPWLITSHVIHPAQTQIRRPLISTASTTSEIVWSCGQRPSHPNLVNGVVHQPSRTLTPAPTQPTPDTTSRRTSASLAASRAHRGFGLRPLRYSAPRCPTSGLVALRFLISQPPVHRASSVSSLSRAMALRSQPAKILNDSRPNTARFRPPTPQPEAAREHPATALAQRWTRTSSRQPLFPRHPTRLRVTACKAPSAAASPQQLRTILKLSASCSTLAAVFLERRGEAATTLLVTALAVFMDVSLAVIPVSTSGSTDQMIRLRSPLFVLAIKLSFVMSQYYEANNRDGQACSFAGNGTVNPLAPSSVSAANSAASSCISNPAATFTPSSPASGGGASSTGASSGSSASGRTNGAVALFGDGKGMLGLGAMFAVGVASAAWTLA